MSFGVDALTVAFAILAGAFGLLLVSRSVLAIVLIVPAGLASGALSVQVATRRLPQRWRLLTTLVLSTVIGTTFIVTLGDLRGVAAVATAGSVAALTSRRQAALCAVGLVWVETALAALVLD